MKLLCIRTDKQKAELAVFDGVKLLEEVKWEAHRTLASTLNKKIYEILNKSSISLQQLQGIVIYRGPGSFTGLRIGFSVANALAYALKIPIVAQKGENWMLAGLAEIENGRDDTITLPEYGAPARITNPK